MSPHAKIVQEHVEASTICYWEHTSRVAREEVENEARVERQSLSNTKVEEIIWQWNPNLSNTRSKQTYYLQIVDV